MSFSTGILAGGTGLGSVALWHYKANPNYRSEKQRYDEGSQWELLAPCEAGDAVVDLKVSDSFFICLNHRIGSRKVCRKVFLQLEPKKVEFQANFIFLQSLPNVTIKLDMLKQSPTFSLSYGYRVGIGKIDQIDLSETNQQVIK